MREFAALFADLDASTSTQAKVAALTRYFRVADPADAAWAVYFLCGGKPRQVVPTALLRRWAAERAGIDDWLFEECYQAVGDLAETLALVLPVATQISNLGLAQWVETRLLPLRGIDPAQQRERLHQWWDELDAPGRFLLTKLIGGGFRVGVSKQLVTRALAEQAGIDAKVVAQRLMGFTGSQLRPGQLPDAARFQALLAPGSTPQLDAAQPYPFFLAHALDADPATFNSLLGPCTDWLAEWKFDGIRAQVVRRDGQCWIWSRGEELVTDRFPELAERAAAWSDGTVLDGEIVVWRDDRPAPFAELQRRIGRKQITRKVRSDWPVRFIAYDLLELQGQDLRGRPLRERRAMLDHWAAGQTAVDLSPRVQADDWQALARQRAASRERGVEGLMLKHLDAVYGVGRTKSGGIWWKWKIEPMSVDAVLIYAQRGHGRRASLYTDYTFAIWNRPPRDAQEAQAVVEAIARRAPPDPDGLQLVAFAKAYSGLSDEEFRRVDAAIRRTTLEKFGPVHSVRPTLVFELAFEGINLSSRHKSGVAVRFPRMVRIRDDKPLHEADSLPMLQAMLAAAPAEPQS